MLEAYALIRLFGEVGAVEKHPQRTVLARFSFLVPTFRTSASPTQKEEFVTAPHRAAGSKGEGYA